MKRYVEGQDRFQATLFPESLDEYIAEDNPVRVVDVFVDELDLKGLGFSGADSTPCRARISRDVGPVFHGMSGHRSTVSRAG